MHAIRSSYKEEGILYTYSMHSSNVLHRHEVDTRFSLTLMQCSMFVSPPRDGGR